LPNRFLRYALVGIAILFVSFNLILWYFGLSSILLTISVYLLLGIVAYLIPSVFFGNSAFTTNVRLASVSLICSLFVVEFILRFCFTYHLTYQERNGNFFNVSEYRSTQLKRIIGKLSVKHAKRYGVVSPANSTRVVASHEFAYQHRYNSYGLRGNEPNKDPTLFNILVLGDSFTEGIGAPEDSTWVSLLGKKVAERCSVRRTQVINAGVAGGDPVVAMQLLKELSNAFSPQVVLIMVNTSDIADIIIRGGAERFGDDGTIRYSNWPWWEPIHQFSYISRYLINAVAPHDWMLLNEKNHQLRKESALRTIHLSICNEMTEYCTAANAKLIVICQPRKEEVFDADAEYVQLVESLLCKGDLHFIDLRQSMLSSALPKTRVDSLYWPVDLHFTPLGYGAVSDMIYNELDTLLCPDEYRAIEQLPSQL